MNPVLRIGAALALVAPSLIAAEFKFGSQTFTIPDGFTMERVAGPGLVERPIEADFDEQGRLYVTDSSGSNEPVAKQLEKKPHRIMRLEDSDGDGVFDRSIVFADKMMFPEGAMWHDGSLYVSAPPVILKLTDTNGDGVADRRENWLDAKTLTGCANDLHGPYMGLDGWIYWCKGAFAEQSWQLASGKMFKTRAAHIFRRRPEGGPLEPVMTGGMDNPVEVAFTPEGERIFTTTFFQQPGGGKRDGLVHAIYGGVYGKVHDVIDDHKKTGDLMPVLTHLGAAAPCGLARYASESFGPEYRDNLFACLFNLHKVTRHVLKPNGAALQSSDSDFVVSDSTDFHPTDVIEDADGSLLIIDTGGWYKICCPTSQLWKPDLLGAIYRVRKTGAPRIDDPRGLKIQWNSASETTLAALLGDARPAVAKRAIEALRKKPAAEPALRKILEGDAPVRQKQNAIWALTRPEPSPAVRIALKDREARVRHAALQSISVTRDKDAADAVTALLRDSDLQVRRAAAEALGRIGTSANAASLLEAAGDLKPELGSALPQRALDHSLIYALIELNAPAETRLRLDTGNHFTKRAALIALDQMDGGELPAKSVAVLLSSSDPVLKQTADWIVAHHPEWGGELASYFRRELKSDSLSAGERAEFEKHLASFAGTPEIQELLAGTAGDEALPQSTRLLALNVMARTQLKSSPHAWNDALTRLCASKDAEIAAHAITAAGAISKPPAALKTVLLQCARNSSLSVAVRLEALATAASGTELDSGLFEFVRASLSGEKPFSVRVLAGSILARARLSDEQLLALAENVKLATPLEIARLLGAFENTSSERVGRALVAALKDSRGLAGLTADAVRKTLEKYPEPVKAQGRAVEALLDEDSAKQAAHLDELLPKIQNGDVRRGQALFNSAKAGCSQCHAIGYLGGNIGPDLTRIGQVRTERDLLEAVVYPSASFVRSFEPLIVSTKSGDEVSGIVRKDGSDEMVLATGPGAEVRIARADIVATRPGKVSVMPQGFGESLAPGELADLVAFLKATRW